MQEEFRDVEGYEGLYQVSNLGNVLSLKYGKEKLKKPSIVRGYYLVDLYKDSIRKHKTIHQLVAMTFLNHKPCGFELVVDHINDNKLDNRLENLQIVTNRFNSHKTQGKGTSIYKGVSFDKVRQKWVSMIQINGKQINLGRFTNELEASEKYNNFLKTI